MDVCTCPHSMGTKLPCGQTLINGQERKAQGTGTHMQASTQPKLQDPQAIGNTIVSFCLFAQLGQIDEIFTAFHIAIDWLVLIIINYFPWPAGALTFGEVQGQRRRSGVFPVSYILFQSRSIKNQSLQLWLNLLGAFSGGLYYTFEFFWSVRFACCSKVPWNFESLQETW